MNAKAVCSALVFVTLFQFAARSAEPGDFLTQVPSPDQAKQPPDKKPADGQKQPPSGPGQPKLPEEAPPPGAPQTDVFAQAPTSVEAPRGFNPHMMGDFGTYFALQQVTLPGLQTTTISIFNPDTNQTITNSVTNPFSQQRIVRVPVSALGAFKVAEGDSPRPQDRVFIDYNFFDNLQGPGASAGFNAVTTNTVGIPGTKLVQTTVSQTVFPGVPPVDLHREVFGFEKTFFDGYASVELRLPMLQQQAVNGFTSNDIGDLTVIGKWALWQDQSTGNILTSGFALTAPTGPGLNTIAGNINSVLLQPFAGYVWNFDRFFLQAFHSVVVPTDSRDVILLFNDVSLNYWMYRGPTDGIITAIVPALECHVTTPLNHRGATDPLVVPDLVVLTGGVHLGLFQHALLTAGVATPVTGPRPFPVEAIVQFNWQF